jgi:hypothetical protein
MMIFISAALFILGLLALLDTVFSDGGLSRIMFAGMLIAMSIWVFIEAKRSGNLKLTDNEPVQRESAESQEKTDIYDRASSEAEKKKPQPVS